MSKLEKLISELCPNGVDYKKIGEVCKFVRGEGISKADKGTGDIPVILYGELYTTYGNYITEVYSKSSSDAVKRSPMIKRGDLLLPISSTTKEAQIGKVSAYCCDYNAYLGGDALLLQHDQYPNYLVHLLNGSWFEQLKMKCTRGTTINHLNPKQLAEIEIPVPPLEIQKEIANILDRFSLLEEELEEELEERRKQYEYYLNMLLMYDEFISQENHVEHKTLGELCDITTGKLNANAKVENGLYPFYTCDESPYLINNYAFDTTAIIISGNGSQVGHINYYSGKFNAYQRTYVLDQVHDVEFKYLLYYLKAHLKNYIVVNSKKGSVPYITLPMLTSFMIDIPSIDTQKHLVNILDRFDKITSSLTEGIPAEIKARHQQYEYYRDKLLTFDRIN